MEEDDKVTIHVPFLVDAIRFNGEGKVVTRAAAYRIREDEVEEYVDRCVLWFEAFSELIEDIMEGRYK